MALPPIPGPAGPDTPTAPTPVGADPGLPPRGTGEAFPSGPYAAALLPDDPPKIGDFWLDGRLAARASGVAYLAHEGDEPTPVMLIMLSEGAADDPAARDRLAGEVNKMHADTVLARGGEGQDDGRLGGKFRNEADDPIGPDELPLAPWAALAYDGSMNALGEADRLLRSVDLSRTPALGAAVGPDFKLPWIGQTAPGRWRTWPLPWPGRKDRASWMTLLVSWLLMLVLAALALLIVILLFQIPPPESPEPPVEGGGGGGSSSETTSASGGEDTETQSASPTDTGSGSGSPSGTSGPPATPTKTPSMQTSGTSGTAPNTPTQNTRL